MADTQDEVATKSIEVAKPTISRERKHKFVFNKCCFCVPLRTGSLILAYLFLVGAIVSGIYNILGITNIILLMLHFPDLSHNSMFVTGLVLNSVFVGLALIAIPFNVLLVIGLHKEKRNFVRLFVRFQWAYIILYALPYIVAVIMGYVEALTIVLCTVSVVLNIFCTLVMRSQYLKMEATVNRDPVGLYKDGHVVITP